MIKLVRTLAFAVALAVPALAQAQMGTATLTLSGHPYNVLGGGGFSTSAFTYTPTAGPVRDFAGFVAWCIDDSRRVTVPGTYTYDVYSFFGFGASALGNQSGSNPTVGAMNRIGSLVDDFQNDVNNSAWNVDAARRAAQNAIWANFNGAAAAGDSGFDSSLWYVLYNGRNQTLAFRVPGMPFIVPEPGSLALLGLGLSGLAVVARRRRTA